MVIDVHVHPAFTALFVKTPSAWPRVKKQWDMI